MDSSDTIDKAPAEISSDQCRPDPLTAYAGRSAPNPISLLFHILG